MKKKEDDDEEEDNVPGWTDTLLISFRSIFVLGLWFHSSTAQTMKSSKSANVVIEGIKATLARLVLLTLSL